MRLGKVMRSVVVLSGLLLGGMAVKEAQAQCAFPLKPTLDAAFQNGCDLVWPPQDGFAEPPTQVVLQPGKLIDRFVTRDRAANDNGQYFSPEGEAYTRRALPYVCAEMAYTVYQVRKPVTLLGGKISPWFGSPGGGTQYRADQRVQELLKSGVIVPVQWLSPAPCDD